MMFGKTIATEIKTKIDDYLFGGSGFLTIYTYEKERKRNTHTLFSLDLLLLYAKSNHLTVVISIWLQTHSVKRTHDNQHKDTSHTVYRSRFEASTRHTNTRKSAQHDSATLSQHSVVYLTSHTVASCDARFKSKFVGSPVKVYVK